MRNPELSSRVAESITILVPLTTHSSFPYALLMSLTVANSLSGSVLSKSPDAYFHLQQVANARTRLAPLLTVTHPNPSPQPFIKLFNRGVILGNAEVIHPTTQVAVNPLHPFGHRDPPPTRSQSPQSVFEISQHLIRTVNS
jgi:hypothetical protein